MNISFYTQTSYPLLFQSGRTGKAYGNQGGISGRYNMSSAATLPGMADYGQEAVYEKPAVSQEMRRLIRDLNKTSRQDQLPYTLHSRNGVKSTVCSFIRDKQFEPSDLFGRLTCYLKYIITQLLPLLL